MPIANRSSHGRHHSAASGGLRQNEPTNESDKGDLRHSGSPTTLSINNGNLNVANGAAMNVQHVANMRKRPHSSRNGSQSGNAQNGNGQTLVGAAAGGAGPGLEFVDLAAWAADVAPQIAIPADSSSALLAAAAAVSSTHLTRGSRYSPVSFH